MAVLSQSLEPIQRRRLRGAGWTLLLIYLGLIGRLGYLQGVQGNALRQEAQQTRQRNIKIRAHRGSIYDRHDLPLASSLYTGTLGFDPTVVRPQDRKNAQLLEKSIVQVAQMVNVPAETIRKGVVEAQQKADALQRYAQQKAIKTPKLRFFPIVKGVSLKAAQQIRDARPALLGFGVEDNDKRIYPGGEKSVQVVGYLNTEGNAQAGLERSCQQWLTGKPGIAQAEVDVQQRLLPDTVQKMIPAQDGLDVHTTLDIHAQQLAMAEAQHIWEQYHPKGISIVVVDPMNGDVLALVSWPTFDPARAFSVDVEERKAVGLGTQKVEGEKGDPRIAERCATRLYEPGSTLKALTIAAALDMGVISTGSHFNCSGIYEVHNTTIHCALHGAAERNGHGWEDPADILRHSCNVGAAQVGLKMGAEKLYDADRKFGLLDPLQVGLPSEQAGRLSFSKTENIHSPVKVARVAFGHSITTTPLHVALAYAAIANGGNLMKPRLIASLVDANGKTVQTFAPQTVRRVISAETSATVMRMLRGVVENGTGKVAAFPGYRMAGKTGTAKKYQEGKYIGSFIGIVPASPNVKPRAVILVAVDEPQGEAYYGADVAAPSVRNLAQKLMEAWKVPQDDPQGTQAKTAAQNMRHAGVAVAPATQKD